MKVSSNRISDNLKYYTNKLELIYSSDEAKNLLLILFEYYFGIDRIKYSMNPDYRLSESEMLKIHFGVKDLLNNIPIQYITGKTEFGNLTIEVNNNVLIPRPETEQLVEIIKSEFSNDREQSLSILDIGTGSGCIALALKDHFVNANVLAADISEDALSVAIDNANNNDLEISFIKCDILNESEWGLFNSINLIVSNPPYIRESEKAFMKKNVLKNEPANALFVTDYDPLIFYRKISEMAFIKLERGGALYFEINEGLGKETKELVSSCGFGDVMLIQDFFGKDRFIRALKK